MATTRFCLIGLTVSEDKTMFTRMLITLCTALAFAAATLPVQAQTLPVTVPTIKSAIENYPKQIRSLSCKLTTTTTLGASFRQSNDNAEGAIPRVQVEKGEWAFKGDKVINESKYIEGNTAPPGHDMDSVYLFDGGGSYQIHSENGGLASRSTYGNREHQTRANNYWYPLQFGYQLDGQWLSDVLNSSNPTLEKIGEDPTSGRLYLTHLKLRDREEQVWFAPRYGNVAVKIVVDGPRPGQRSVYTGGQYERVGNLWMPLQGDFQLLTTLSNGQTILQVDKKFVFSDIQVNNVPAGAFDFKWPTGAALYDNDTRTKLYRDASGRWVKRTDVAEEIAHTPSRVSAADFAPWVLLVSLAALFTLGYLRWRRRASA